MNKKIIIGSLLGCLFGATVGYSASVVTLPHTFTAGTAIKASEVNANFSALAQEIASIKGGIGLNKSSNYSEMAITPISAAIGSTVTSGSKSFLMKQKVGIEDPITGQKYTLNYPAGTSDLIVYATGCKALAFTNLVVKAGNGSNFVNYVTYRGAGGGYSGSASVFYIQITDNLCAYDQLEFVPETSQVMVSPLMDRAVDLQKYISVQAI